MKKRGITIVLFILVCTISYAQKISTLKIDYSFVNVLNENDYPSVLKVYVDGTLSATSEEFRESVPSNFCCNISKGNHTVKLIICSLYKGKWEEHSLLNNYSIDCIYEFTQKFSKSTYKITLIFDINSGTTAKIK